jgi:methionyl-tRNA formyltransferase
MTPHRIVLAAAHARYDALESALRTRHGCEVLRLRARDELTIERLRAFDPRYVLFPHWSWRIPPTIYEAFECVIFHMTDVPFGRGGTPLQNLIVRGFEQTQLSALRCVAELDAGPVYLKRPLSLLGTAEEILLRASVVMEQMIGQLVTEEPEPKPQTGEPVLFTRRTPEQSDLSAASTLGQVHDMIRMLDAEGYPRAFIEVGKLRLEFARASLRSDHLLADVRITIIGEQEAEQ